MVTICTANLTFSNSTFCPHSVFMCFVWIWEQTAIISLYNINWLAFITETECVYCAVRTGSLYLPLKVRCCLYLRGRFTVPSNPPRLQFSFISQKFRWILQRRSVIARRIPPFQYVFSSVSQQLLTLLVVDSFSATSAVSYLPQNFVAILICRTIW